MEPGVLAEHVDPARMRRAAGERLAAHELHIVVRALGELGRDDVRAQEGHVLGQLARDPAAALLGLDVQAVARLDLLVGDPVAPRARLPLARRGPAARRLGPSGWRLWSRGSRRLVAPARHPRRGLVRPVAGEHEVSVAVHEAREDRAPRRVDVLVADARSGVCPAATRPSSTSAPRARGSRADRCQLRSPGHQLPDVVDHQRRQHITRSSRPITSTLACSLPRTIQRPSTITSRTSAAVPAKPTWAPGRRALPRPCAPTRGPRRTSPHTRLARSLRRPSRAPRIRSLSRRAAGRRLLIDPAFGRETLVEFHRPRLLEHVDHRVRVRAQCEPSAILRELRCQADAVGEIALSRRAEAAGRRARRQQPPVAVVQVGRVHGREARLEAAGIGEQLHGGATVGGAALLILEPLLGDVGMERHVAGARPGGDLVQLIRAQRADACAAPAMRAVSVGSSASTRSTQAPTLASAKRRWKPLTGSSCPPCR